MIQVLLPYQLQVLAGITAGVALQVEGPVTPGSVIAALESRYPMLKGAVLDHENRKRRPLIRFFACSQDISHEPLDTPLPEAVVTGKEPFRIIGAIAGG
jgi:molybdopterin synthase sulfur carrier subunit